LDRREWPRELEAQPITAYPYSTELLLASVVPEKVAESQNFFSLSTSLEKTKTVSDSGVFMEPYINGLL